MATWQFWTLIGVLVLILLAIVAVDASIKSLWAKLHEVRTAIDAIPALDYREDLARLQRPLESLSDDMSRMAQSYPAVTDDE